MIAKENSYYACLCFEEGGLYHVDLRRKKPISPANIEFLIDIFVALPSNNDVKLKIYVPIGDHYLSRDLQTIGFTLQGYLATDSTDGLCMTLWDRSGMFSELSFEDLDENAFKNSALVRLVLNQSQKIRYVASFGKDEYLEICRLNERYFSGLTEVCHDCYKPLFLENIRKSPNPKTGTEKFDISILQSIISDCFFDYYNQRNNSEVTDLDSGFDLFFSIKTVDHFSSEQGFYKTGVERGNLEKISDIDVNKILENSLLNTEYSDSQEIWIIIAVKAPLFMEKYGKRGYQFMFIDTGILLNKLHECCNKYGAALQVIGSFDNQIVDALVPDHCLTTSLATIRFNNRAANYAP